MCNGTCRKGSKYCPNCKRTKDNVYSILTRAKKRIVKLATEEKYDEYWFLKLEASIEAIRPQREILLEYIKKDIEILENKKATI